MGFIAVMPAFAQQGSLTTTSDYQDKKIKIASSCPQMSDGLPPLSGEHDGKIHINADEVDLSEEGLSQMLGSVRVRQDDREITAEQLDYDDAEKRAIIDGTSRFRSKDYVIESRHTELDFDDQTGLFTDNQFTLMSRSARGDAARMEVRGDKTADLRSARYTSCAPGNNDWYLEASRIQLDQEEGLGTAHNARLRFLGVPIFYSPWLQFPIDDRRRSGLLYPIVGDTDRTGFDVRQPVYLNLAPNYDLTLTPRYMSERGFQIGGDGRYLFASAEGQIGYQYLDRDRVTHERRDYLKWRHEGLLSPHLSMDVQYNDVSDPTYFEDLGGDIDLSSISFIERSARFNYQAPAKYSIQVLAQDYQRVASNLEAAEDPYRRLPQVLFSAQTRNSFLYSRLGIDGEYVNFARDNSVEGQRVDVAPYLKIERDALSWYGEARVDYHYTTYELTSTEAGEPSSPDRSLPIFSAEYGLRFERLLADGTPQTLEPRLFYLYAPHRDQSALPVFDGGQPDFDFTQLFARNRFSGLDRIGDANQVAMALTARQLDPSTGGVKAQVSVGQLYRIEAPTVGLPNQPIPDNGATDFIGEVIYNLSERWGTRALTQWSPESSRFTRGAIAIRYRDDGRRLFEAAYRYRRGLLEQTDLTAVTPLFGPFSLAGRLRYSLEEEQTLDAYAGLRYETCCWAANVAMRRYISDSQGNFNNGVYVQLELKGLGQIGSGFPNLRVDDDVY